MKLSDKFTPTLHYRSEILKFLTCFIVLLFLCLLCEGQDNIFKTYKENFSKSENGIYENADTCYVVATFGTLKDDDKNEARGMLMSHEMLSEKYFSDCEPVNESLLDYSQFIKSEARKIKNKTLSYKFARLRILENVTVSNKYRYVSAVALSEIEEQKKILKKELEANKKDKFEYSVEILQKLSKEYRTKSETEKLLNLSFECGGVETAISTSNSNLIQACYLAPYLKSPRADALNIFYSYQKASESTEKGINSLEEMNEILKNAPCSFPVLKRLKDYYLAKGNFSASAVIYYTMFIGAEQKEYPNILKELTSCLNKLKDKSSCKEPFDEYCALIERLKGADFYENSLFKDRQSLVLKYVFKSFGHVNYPESFSTDKNEELISAMDLFSQGKEIDKIIRLLLDSIEKSPRNNEAWSYLGAAMLAKKEYIYAVVLLNQAIFTDSENGVAKCNLAVAYNELGYKNLSKGVAFSVLLSNKNTEWSLNKSRDLIKSLVNNK